MDRRWRGDKKINELTDDGWRLLRFCEKRFRAEQDGLARFFEHFWLAERERERAP